MSMWKRLSRAVSSNLERFRDDPLGTIKRDIASFNADLETLQEQVKLLENDQTRLVREEEELGDQIRAALKAGQRDRGLDLAERLSGVRRDKQNIERHLESTRRVVRRAEGVQESLREDPPKPVSGRSTPGPTAPPLDRDPVIVVKARETLDRLERELGSAPEGGESKTLGGGEVTNEKRPQATKTLAGASVAFEEPESRTPAEADHEPEPVKTLGSTSTPSTEAPTVKVEAKSAIGSKPPLLKVEPKAKESVPAEASALEVKRAALAEDLDLVDELERLAQLRESGALCEEEFRVAKQKLIDP